MNALWQFVALLGFAGWMVTLVMVMRYMLPMANALGALQKISGFVDDRIATQLERAKRVWDAKGMPTATVKPQPPQRQQQEPADPIYQVFGGPVLEPFGDQPEAEEGIEVME